MPYGEVVQPPVSLSQVKNPLVHNKAWAGSDLRLVVLDRGFNMVARGTGASWNENYRQYPVEEWDIINVAEVVTGHMPIGQLTIQTIATFAVKDQQPTYKNLPSWQELTAVIQVGGKAPVEAQGLILDVFEGVKYASQSANYSANSLYLQNAQLIYRMRHSPAEWVAQNPALAENYPASVGAPKTFSVAPTTMEIAAGGEG